MILDHIGFAVRDFARSRAFYLAALAPLGIAIVKEGDGWTGFNQPGQRGGFWISRDGDPPSAPLHVAFAAPGRGQVRAFYDAAIAAGGRDNGAPGLRVHYHADYYGAFVLDPDGHNIEAVSHTAESA